MSTATTEKSKSRVNRRVFSAEAEASHLRQQKQQPAAASHAHGVQTKLKVGQPNDRYEREADTMADRIIQLPKSPTTTESPSETAQQIHRSSLPSTSSTHQAGAPAVQADFESNEQESIQPKRAHLHDAPGLQASSDGELTTTQGFSDQLSSHSGNGSPLPSDLQGKMEGQMGADLSGVRTHTDSQAAQLSQNLGAKAFTHGSDIYFNEGQYNPSSSEGQHLIAHETTHTVQQGAAPSVQAKTDEELNTEAEGNVSEDLAKELAAADKAQQDAIDPGPAQQAQAQAKEGLPDELLEPEPTAIPEEAPSKEPKAEVPPGDLPPPPPPPAAEPPPENLGSVGKDLNQQAANVCGEAEASATQLATNEQTHDDADTVQQQTEAAVVQPDAEGQALSNTQQVGEVQGKPAPSISQEEAKRTMDQAVSEAVPTDIDSLNEFKSKGKAQIAGAKVMAVVQKDVDQVKNSYNEMEQSPQPTPQATAPQELPAIVPAPVTPPLNLGTDAVPPLKEEHTDFSNYQQESDDALKKEKITDEQLAMVDKGDLAEAAKERGALKKKVDTSPGEVQQLATQEQQKVEGDMAKEEQKVRGEMTAERDAKLNQGKEDQKKTKTALELKREAVAKHINDIYEKAQSTVKTRLGNLEKDNAATFDREQKKYSKEFEHEVNRDINRWKRKRYSGLFAGVKWLKDKLFGIDEFPEVKAAFDRGRANFVRKIDALIVRISKANDQVIQDCKTTLDTAKVEIQKYVDGLGPELKSAGEAAQADADKKLKELDGFIDKKKEELAQKLCDMKDAAIEAIDKKIEEMKASMSGLVNQLIGLLLNAMLKFFQWALEAAGFDTTQLMKILDKGVRVITKIVTDPIGFIVNLVNGVGQGIKNFSANIAKHLKQGLFDWLTGAMSSVPIQLPEKWDFKGVMYLALQILGLTWDNIRAQLVKEIGEEKVAAAEKTVDIVKRLITEGPIALWDMLKEKAQEIFDTIVGEIKNFIATKLIQQGIIKILSFLNPAGAIVQAILAIYKAIMFFIDNWDRIVQWVKTIFGAIADIAFGNIGKVAAAVEKGAAMLIPLILDFVAKLLNFDKIADVVQKAIEKVRAPINKGIRKFIGFVKKKAKSLFSKKKRGIKENEKLPSPQEREAAKQKALKDIRKLIGKGIYLKDLKVQLKKIKAKYKIKRITLNKKYDVEVENSATEVVYGEPSSGSYDLQASSSTTGNHSKYSKVKSGGSVKLGKFSYNAHTNTPTLKRNIKDKKSALSPLKHATNHHRDVETHLDLLADVIGNFPDFADRPTSIDATLHGYWNLHGRMQRGGGNTTSIVGHFGNIEDPLLKGQSSVLTGHANVYNGGHLLAHTMGGREEYHNLTPQKGQVVNNGVYGKLEDWITSKMALRNAAQMNLEEDNMRMKVNVIYGSEKKNINLTSVLPLLTHKAGMDSGRAKNEMLHQGNRGMAIDKYESDKMKPGATDQKRTDDINERYQQAKRAYHAAQALEAVHNTNKSAEDIIQFTNLALVTQLIRQRDLKTKHSYNLNTFLANYKSRLEGLVGKTVNSISVAKTERSNLEKAYKVVKVERDLIESEHRNSSKTSSQVKQEVTQKVTQSSQAYGQSRQKYETLKGQNSSQQTGIANQYIGMPFGPGNPYYNELVKPIEYHVRVPKAFDVDTRIKMPKANAETTSTGGTKNPSPGNTPDTLFIVADIKKASSTDKLDYGKPGTDGNETFQTKFKVTQ